MGKILRELSERRGVEILEAECCRDHIHMLVSIPPRMSAAQYYVDTVGKHEGAIGEYVCNQLQDDISSALQGVCREAMLQVIQT